MTAGAMSAGARTRRLSSECLHTRLRGLAWAARASRKAALEIAARLEAVAGAAALNGGGILVTHRAAERCEAEIDLRTGRARAMLRMRFLVEPA